MDSLFEDLRRMNKRQFLYQVLSFGMIVSSALMIWKGFLTNYHEDPIRVGEIVVFKVEGRDIPIVHRVLKLHERLE